LIKVRYFERAELNYKWVYYSRCTKECGIIGATESKTDLLTSEVRTTAVEITSKEGM
jgi:hypothetical protein